MISQASVISMIKARFQNILAIDFETVPNGDTYHIGAVLNDKSFERKDIKNLQKALEELARFSQKADFILGHNIVNHDLPIAKAQFSEAKFLNLPIIDTLFLSPLAFPENPYHKLVKNYKLVKTSKNSPVADAKLAMAVFNDQIAAFADMLQTNQALISFFTFAFDSPCNETLEDSRLNLNGIFKLFHTLSKDTPDPNQAKKIFQNLCRDKICSAGFDEVWEEFCNNRVKKASLAYVLSWVMVSGGNSIIPPWVRHEFKDISKIVRKLRHGCGNKSCLYCAKKNNSEKMLKKYFGFKEYRKVADGRLLQKQIIDSNLAGNSGLAVLPTGGGKSICYQIPALHRYERVGELTLVISPLKALMKDQVDNLNSATGLECAAAINGSLTLPERGDIMEKVRLGDIGILYISPEQLRNYSIAQLIMTRQVGCWVFDEAHCLSKWGHDFRPDYLNVANFIAEYSKKNDALALVSTFTATAKKDVIEEITTHFEENLNLDLEHFISGVQRENLNYQVWPVTKNEKSDVIFKTIHDTLSQHAGAAIVYCSSRKKTENLSKFLNEKGISSQHFHAGRSEPDKRNIQDDFIHGAIRVICATNAFGMGIDKKDIRLVIHADIPGSLENYLQEAGRAGRDLEPSECILLYEQEDIENQFALNSFSRVSLKDIKKILAILKQRGAKTPDIIITPGEIMRLAGHNNFDGNDTTARIGVSWLERKGFVKRSFNQTLFFKGTPTVKNMEDARKKINSLNLSKSMRSVYLTIMETLFNARADSLLSADTLLSSLGTINNLPEQYLDSRYIINLLSDMAQAGLIKEGVVMTAFVRPKGKDSSVKLLHYFCNVEKSMLEIMVEMSPDSHSPHDIPSDLTPGISPGIASEFDSDKADIFNLRLMSQRLKDRGFEDINSHVVEKILRSMANDKGKNSGKSLKIKGRKGVDQRWVYLKFSWDEIKKRVELRHNTSMVTLETIIARLPLNLRHGQAQVLSEFFISDITKAMQSNLFLSDYGGDKTALIENCLLYLHDLKIIILQNGLGVFRQAMNLKIPPESQTRQYTKGDYEPLSHHYGQKNVQVHVMDKYAALGLEKIRTAMTFVNEYFSSSYDDFISTYFPGQTKIIKTAMTAQSYKDIIQSLENSIQESIVAAPPEKNILVLAGPGSGKTKTIVHRCAWLIKAKSIDPSSILVLCFNHQAMLELRKRIKALAGKSANAVTAMTYHGFAMRLAGRSFMETSLKFDPNKTVVDFDTIIDEAIDILNGDRPIAGVDQSQTREYLLAQYRYILVDEYQDIDARQYNFISALTGRLDKDSDSKISIMAVGDDDQSIYAFRDANVKFIKKFEQDYNARLFFMVENYRSSHSIIKASSSLIAFNRVRMKNNMPLCINKKRAAEKHNFNKFDKHSKVQIVHTSNIECQACFVAEKIQQIMHGQGGTRPDVEPGIKQGVKPGTNLDDFAVISRLGISFPFLVAARMALAKKGIPFCYSIKNSSGFPLFKIREIQNFISFLEKNRKSSMTPLELKQKIQNNFQHQNAWTAMIRGVLDAWCNINSDIKISIAKAKDFAVETLMEEKKEHKTGKGVFLGTVHSIKGMECAHVFILDGGWQHHNMEDERRLYYVGMTRAKKRLYLCSLQDFDNPHILRLTEDNHVNKTTIKDSQLDGFNNNITISIIGMKDLYISYAGLFHENHVIHQYLSNLETGEKIQFLKRKEKIFIVNSNKQIIAALSKKGYEKWQHRISGIISAKILGILKNRSENMEQNEFNKNLKTTSWELPVIEVLHKR
jgi:ATP-dependent DNA helicase RecQ